MIPYIQSKFTHDGVDKPALSLLSSAATCCRADRLVINIYTALPPPLSFKLGSNLQRQRCSNTHQPANHLHFTDSSPAISKNGKPMATTVAPPNFSTSTSSFRASQNGPKSPPYSDNPLTQLPRVDFNFEDLRQRMNAFTVKFDAFIEKGRKRVLEERNEFRGRLGELSGMCVHICFISLFPFCRAHVNHHFCE